MSPRHAAAALVVALLAACAAARARPPSPVTFDDDLDVASLRQAIERTTGVAASTRAARSRLLAILDAPDDAAARAAAIERSFRVVRVSESVLVTGYYEPELAARRVASAASPATSAS